MGSLSSTAIAVIFQNCGLDLTWGIPMRSSNLLYSRLLILRSSTPFSSQASILFMASTKMLFPVKSRELMRSTLNDCGKEPHSATHCVVCQ